MIGRLIHLQGAQRQLLDERVSRQSTFREVVPARSGEILDRNGHVLAMTVTRESLFAVPSKIEDVTDFCWKVSTVVDINTDKLYERICSQKKKQFI